MTVFFDLDGTLLDTAADFMHAANALQTKLGLPNTTLETLKPAVSHGLIELMQVCFNVRPADPHYMPLTKQLLALYEQSITLYTKPFPGVLALLTDLDQHHIRWGIVTNRPQHFTEQLLQATHLKERACCVVSGDSTPNPKPHPDPLFFACQQIAADPKHCMYVGDAERDIQAGKAAGMTTLGVLFGYIPDIPTALQWGADDYVQHADEILPKVLAWQTA